LSFALDLISFREFNMDMAITVKDPNSVENRLRDIFMTKEEFVAFHYEIMKKLNVILLEIKKRNFSSFNV